MSCKIKDFPNTSLNCKECGGTIVRTNIELVCCECGLVLEDKFQKPDSLLRDQITNSIKPYTNTMGKKIFDKQYEEIRRYQNRIVDLNVLYNEYCEKFNLKFLEDTRKALYKYIMDNFYKIHRPKARYSSELRKLLLKELYLFTKNKQIRFECLMRGIKYA